MVKYGVTPEGFNLKRLDEIYAEVSSALKEQIGVDPSENPQGILNVITTVFCDQIASLWEEYSNGYENLFPLTAEGIALDRCMEIGGVSRIGKSRTTYMLACTGKEGTTIPAGAVVQTSTSPTRQFQCATISEISSKNWKTLKIRPIDSISGTFTFGFEIERNATSGTVGSETDGSSFSKDLTVASYDDAVTKIYEALSGFNALTQYGISVTKEGHSADDYCIVLSGSTESDSFSSTLCSYVTIVSVTSNIFFESADYGKVNLANGTITKIVSIIDGFDSVTNLVTPTLGRLTQTDSEARSSYINRLANRARGTVDSIVSVLYSDVDGVTYAKGYQNDTDDTDSAGRPPHSLEIVVQGGSDNDIADVIWNNKAAGIRAYGSYYAYATDASGNRQYVEFTRVKDMYLLLSITITSEGGLDDDYVERIQALLSKESLDAGQNVRLQKFIRPIMDSVSGVDYLEIRGLLSESPDVSKVQDSAMRTGVVPVSIGQQPVIVANGVRVVKAK